MAPTVTALQVSLNKGDVLVMPEVGGEKWQFLTKDLPVVMPVSYTHLDVYKRQGFVRARSPVTSLSG